MAYNRRSEIIGGLGVIIMTTSVISIIVENMANTIVKTEPSYILSAILMGVGAILTPIGLLTGGFETKDNALQEDANIENIN